MTIWLRKRRMSGLTTADMANELGLSYTRYEAIEKGDIKMPSNLMDKFNEIINRGKQNEITNAENNVNADRFWEEVKQKKEDGTYVIQDKMREFNIPNMPVLVKLMGYKSPGTVYNYLQNRVPAGAEFKKRLYNFFSDERNVQLPAKKQKQKRNVIAKCDPELDAYWENTDFIALAKQFNVCKTDVANAIGVHNSTICNMFNRKNKPGYNTLAMVKEYFERLARTAPVELPKEPSYEPAVDVSELVKNNEEESVEQKSEPVGVIRRYACELDEISQQIKKYNDKIKELEIRRRICIEVLDAINELTHVEE